MQYFSDEEVSRLKRERNDASTDYAVEYAAHRTRVADMLKEFVAAAIEAGIEPRLVVSYRDVLSPFSGRRKRKNERVHFKGWEIDYSDGGGERTHNIYTIVDVTGNVWRQEMSQPPVPYDISCRTATDLVSVAQLESWRKEWAREEECLLGKLRAALGIRG